MIAAVIRGGRRDGTSNLGGEMVHVSAQAVALD
jgi:hypothetical protein